ncbi:MAG: riboflavin synthase [Methyloligellaceae bacterium]
MFTGLISDIGRVEKIDGGRIRLACGYQPSSIPIGASISCDGCCLTATEVAPAANGGALFSVDASNETLSRTTLGRWQPGQAVNLERALTLKDELGGHIVTGHVDAIATIIERSADGDSIRFRFECPEDLAHLIAPKGSVALDGTSLTVNEVEGCTFGVNIIPHTLDVTTWGEKEAGDSINLEVDLLARYVARISEAIAAR